MKRILTIAFILFAAPALAEPIPAAELTALNANCVAGRPNDHRQIVYCRCVTNRIGEQLSYQALLTSVAEAMAPAARGAESAALLRDERIKAIVMNCRSVAGMPR